ncbi:S46 family peptidase [Pelomonas sp. KK5]|uniref:S46 family peptidase n=1 Tax=Pelomonas sp. KK5 TaxID=1855730 RepID=UPI00097C3AE4|nr:S46 family peptidase [Pelomonas sp. KK5]
MKRFALAALTLALGPVLSQSAHAAEGMWMPKQLPQLARPLKATGLTLDPAKLASLTEYPMSAVVSLGGCSASFVSPQGLVVTNHHCVYGSLQYNSKPERDLMKNGFLSNSLAEELPAAPGTRVLVTVEASDVSAQVIDAAAAKLQGKARIDAMEKNEKALVAACEAEPGYRCNVNSFFGGLQYQLIKQMEVRDVRLVYAPAGGIGNFGGETDNWMWPRHTGDFGYFRAYVGRDGKPADYSPDNKPYQPKSFLKIASTPLKDQDFVMVAGYPGRTNRLRLPSEADFNLGFLQPAIIKAYGEELEAIAAATDKRPDAAIVMANRVKGLNNTLKNYQGQDASYQGSDILARKQQDFAAMKKWVMADAKRRALYAADIEQVEQLLAQQQATARSEFLLRFTSPALLNSARTLVQLGHERAKPDAERKSGYQERDMLRLRQGLQALDRRYDETTDKAVVAHFLGQYLTLPAEQLNGAFLKALGVAPGMDAAAIKARLDALYAGSQLKSMAERLQWLARPLQGLEASNDSFVGAAVALYADDERRETRDKELAGRLQQAYANTMAAQIAFKASQGQIAYADANSTLRVSFGKVTGRTPGRDGEAWQAFSTLRGIAAKATGEGEFDAPATELAAIRKRDFGGYQVASLESVPVNFLATLDTTGGNSGSPVLNGKAELVGLLFDGTLDGVIASWDYNDRMNRSICLDARYMLWTMKVVDKADRLLKEMDIK